MSTARQIIEEESEKLIERLTTKGIKKVLKEDNIIIDSLTKETNYNSNNQIVEDNWKWFKDTLLKASMSSIFQHNSKAVNSKLYAVKYFTKINFMLAESIEDEIKFELKDYFGKLTTDDVNEFINSFFNLPFEFTSLVIRYLTNLLAKDKKDLLAPSLKDANLSLEKIIKKKEDFVKNVNNISLGRSQNFSIIDMQLLLDVRAFYDYNPVNVGTCEFIIRMLKCSKDQLKEKFGIEKTSLFLQQILTLPSYQKHLSELSRETINSYFDNKGMQRKGRNPSYYDCVMEIYDPKHYIPKKEAQTKKKTNTLSSKKDSNENNKVSALQPSEEELMKQ